MHPSDDKKVTDLPDDERQPQFNLHWMLTPGMLVVATILAGLLVVVVLVAVQVIREANKPPLSVVFQKELENRFEKGTSRKDIEEWVADKNFETMGFSFWSSLFFTLFDRIGHKSPLELAGLGRTEVSFVLRAQRFEDTVKTTVYFFFDHNDQLIKFYIHESRYSL
jgi:hypothetical protein